MSPVAHTRGRSLLVSAIGALALLAAGSCVARSGDPYQPIDLEGDAGPRYEVLPPDEPLPNLPAVDPHAVLGVEPQHGPYTGGQTVLVRGAGLGERVRVWLGETEVPTDSVLVLDGVRVQITTPAHAPGTVDVSVQNGDDTSTRRTLPAAYTYDAFAVRPGSGPTTGGTRIVLTGQGTQWTADATTVEVDTSACTALEVRSATELACTTPPGTTGSKPIVVRTGVEQLTLLDAFSYVDSVDGYRAGLSGSALEASLTVLVLDRYTGRLVPGATVVLDADLAGAQRTDRTGTARFTAAEGTSLGPEQTVTVAKDCYEPITLVDVPVDTVTVYLDPLLSPRCGERGELPATGGSSTDYVDVKGELVWPSTNEFKREGWSNVPPPRYEGDTRVAYVFRAASSATQRFSLPSESRAVLPEDAGELGYRFSLEVAPGTYTLYAVAGLENRTRTPPMFKAYALGLARGVVARSGASPEVFLDMGIPLDHGLEVDVTGPTPGPRGPDRVIATVAVRLADREHLLFPGSEATKLLPITEPFRFVGLPALVGSLAGAQYVLHAEAVTGSGESQPASSLGTFGASSEAGDWKLDDFVALPVLVEPPPGEPWNGGRIAVETPPGGAPVSLTVVEIESGGGLLTWTIALPEGVTTVDLPDLDALGSGLGLVPGPLTVVVTNAHIDGFDYSALSYRELSASGWDASAQDTFHVRP